MKKLLGILVLGLLIVR